MLSVCNISVIKMTPTTALKPETQIPTCIDMKIAIDIIISQLNSPKLT